MKAQCSVSECQKISYCRGYCKAHYSRLWRNGDPVAGRTGHGEPMRWLVAHRDYQSDECLLWPFRKRWNGYGDLRIGSRSIAASRKMCELAHGLPRTPGNAAAHSCGNGFGGCVNPRHLRWATKSENEQEKLWHGTSNRGERHGMAKLTAADVVSMRSMQGTRTQKDVAALFGVGRAAVYSIWSRKNWAWLK